MPFVSTMRALICLVKNMREQLMVNSEALRILEKISQPLVVVAIVGLCRTGKSYIMNRLAGQNSGYPLGSTVRSQTKGIWMWCLPHPNKPNHTLVLFDTEGLGDVEKNDSWIFALAMLLSSTFVYNSMGTINHQALEQLHYVTELTQLTRAKCSPKSDEVEDSAEFVSFFPDFVCAVRDFTLELKLDGHDITEDEYLENALKLIPGRNPRIQNSNKSRECIRYFFPVWKCFVFDWPTSDKKLLCHMENVTENQLEWNFQVQTKNFCTYIFTMGKTKTLREGIIVTGNRLGTLVKTYMDAINSGTVPCMENAVTILAHRENTAAVQKAANNYSEQMAQRLGLPTDTLQELLDVHTAYEREAIANFMELSFKDENQEFQKMLVVIHLKRKKEDFVLKNEEASIKYCQDELKKLSEPLIEGISRGAFSVPGGHSLYLEAKRKVEQDYQLVPRKGVKASEALQSFLKSQDTIQKSILQSDKALTEGEKAIDRKEAAEKEQELLKQKQKEQEEIMEVQERSFRENMAQLQEKWEMERKNILREQERMLQHKLKVQEELLIDGFKQKSEELNKEINQLKEESEISKNKSPSIFSQFLDTLDTVFIAVRPGAGKLLGAGLKILSSHI
uniref:GB1/RHD3-type G domain-containing protein n=1 Tax=Castor canadensis TaxID=51338 RepID=A0A8C0XPM8_CASCN